MYCNVVLGLKHDTFEHILDDYKERYDYNLDTEMMAGVREKFKEDSQVQLPQQRMARPEEVGDLIAFLMSPQSSYVSGAVIPVDGGLTAHSAGMPFPKRKYD